ncbi:putative glyoxalase superfamily protein PhnB [Luteibacter rhizovicinus]|uniref:Putative glyoxalase superfamily protein PhnB n=1 Tax=Luteibacter rhizovicinus TaxID=242606 RepID=A0A4R3YUY9_9GAMM|nr:VOC family protein [Luteibacter rhizovicinus]TCV96380.1 putative glyoxalase superfamily protein PhnB [Luteibacter rhizovicinus]
MKNGSTIIPCLRYRDAHAAIDFLCRAFGFERQAVYEDEKGDVQHAQLTYGAGMIMLGSVRPDTDFGQCVIQPDEIGGKETQCACVTVVDCRAHYETAKAVGATIVDDYAEKDYGGAGYSARDPEGHLWWFGSYDPWQGS